MHAVTGSGIRFMSDSLIAFQPAIEEPSNIWPSAKVSSSIIVTSKVTCCHLPRGSVNRKSTYFTSLSAIIFMTSLAVVMACVPFSRAGTQLTSSRFRHMAAGAPGESCATKRSDGVKSGFPCPDPDGFFDAGDENLAVANPPGLGGAPDRLDGFFDHVVAQHNLDLHLGQKIDHVL